MEKMKMHSPNLTQENITRIRELFPDCVTEAHGDDGRLTLAVDFDQLRQELSESIVEGPQERYHLNWPGKREALLTANAPIARTLRPCRKESVNFDTTKNLFIEGDNLEALKLLQETYLGKVKMIYIDPPYNTGNDFIYKDNFAENVEEFLKRSNQKDEEGNRLISNTEANGRFHSDWLSMMYSRLKLVRNLLSEDGAIFISIDDNEQQNLRKICDELFGEENFVNCISVKLSEATGVKMSHANSRFPKTKEYVLFYRRGSEISIKPVQVANESWNDEYKEIVLDLDKARIERIKELIYQEISTESDLKELNQLANGAKLCSLTRHFRDIGLSSDSEKDEFKWSNAWRIIQAVGAGSLKDRALISRKDGQELSAVLSSRGKLSLFKTYFDEESRDPRIRILFADKYLQHNPGDFWSDIKTAGGVALEGGLTFPNGKKPLKLLKRLIDTITSSTKEDIVLDFFAGSGTTAHAVMELNAEDGGTRKSILVQLREPAAQESEAFKEGLKYVSDICKERLRRAGKKILESECHEGWNKDIGFRVLKVDSSNMADVYYSPDAADQSKFQYYVDNIKPDRKPEDLLFQVLLDWGVDLSLPIRKETIQGKAVFFVNESPYDLVACFDTGVNEDLVKELAKFEPLRVVFRDAGFATDAAKINVEQIFKQMSPGTDVKSI
ncbi:MAG: site-specific DNA-methyltransferase [Desulfomicrobium sp.]|nr:site-specific DNA-methyltransferase [Pseudomonadota bacterium]MBV1713315.1 site-specific DNA-methyltransferase [Desulfomicrobium sp.]MBU4570551.1 site-specific DNA-methyltransferase [Pseudomonadota bacterium]MBU4593909.1 site-specific DNA-methyltransferase [Pseudomonadota bacterium]MBV1721802.1 site-specific DNA-methyltransferase [Desulfomicrobium sp.]